MVTVYDTKGEPHEKEAVDARECVKRLGWTMEDPKADKKAKKDDTKKTEEITLKDLPDDGATLRGLLDSANVPWKQNTKIADLKDLVIQKVPQETLLVQSKTWKK